jgi:hypothetical protein
MRRLRIPLLCALAFITSSTPASAACAWVLWEETAIAASNPELNERLSQQDRWKPNDGYQTKAECERVLERASRSQFEKIRRGATDDEQVSSPVPGYIVRTFPDKGATIAHTLKCLPDTIDPRRPR